MFSNSQAGRREPRSSGKYQSGPTFPEARRTRVAGAPVLGHGSGSVAGHSAPKPHVSKRTVDGSKPHNLGQSKLSEG